MFERRGPGVARKNEDSWDFGMAWVEGIDRIGGSEQYLCERAEVTYLGMATRKTRFGLIKPVYR